MLLACKYVSKICIRERKKEVKIIWYWKEIMDYSVLTLCLTTWFVIFFFIIQKIKDYALKQFSLLISDQRLKAYT